MVLCRGDSRREGPSCLVSMNFNDSMFVYMFSESEIQTLCFSALGATSMNPFRTAHCSAAVRFEMNFND